MALLDSIKKHSIALVGIAITALIILVVIVFATDGFGFDSLHSPSKVLQDQTNALLRGDLSLSKDIKDLRYDMVWHNDSVSQVWGLGVPLLRVPFFFLPEGIIFMIYVFATLYIVGFVSYLFLLKHKVQEAGILSAFVMFLVGLFPPVLMIMKTRFVVYEEVITYGYFYVCALLFLLVGLSIKKTSHSLFWTICFMSGAAGLVRPTLYAYALPVFAAACLWAVAKQNKKNLFIGIVLFSLGVGSLLVTNHIRFGSVFEFGHHVNVALDVNSVNLTRFESEYTSEVSFIDKAKETFGIAFLVDEIPSKNGLYVKNIFPFQTEEIRWRHIIFPTLHWYYLAIFVLLAWAGYKYRSLFFYIPAASFVLLFGFYSTSFIISSRYLIDFAATFVIAGSLVILFVSQDKKKIYAVVSITLISVLYIYGAYSDLPYKMPSTTVGPRSIVQKEIRQSLPEKYVIGTEPGMSQFNGVGWSYQTGSVQSSAIFFVSQPEFISVKFVCRIHDCGNFDEHINARLDGKILSRKTVYKPEGKMGKEIHIMFEVEKERAESASMQVLFVQMARIGETLPVADFMLKELSWK